MTKGKELLIHGHKDKHYKTVRSKSSKWSKGLIVRAGRKKIPMWHQYISEDTF